MLNVFNVYVDFCFAAVKFSCFLLKFRPVAAPTASEDAAVKPDKPSPGRAARPLPRLDRKCVKKPPAPSTTSKNNTSGEADVTGKDAATDEVGYSLHPPTFHRFGFDLDEI